MKCNEVGGGIVRYLREDGNVYETKKIKEIIVTVQIEGEFNL